MVVSDAIGSKEPVSKNSKGPRTTTPLAQQSQKWAGEIGYFIRKNICHSKTLKRENQPV